ncbi:hypothetical protein KGM_206469A, partial [Danaus plexippus plexippus]
MDRPSGNPSSPPHASAYSGFGAFCSAISETLSRSFVLGRTAVICPTALIYRNTRAINEQRTGDVQRPGDIKHSRHPNKSHNTVISCAHLYNTGYQLPSKGMATTSRSRRK